MTPVPEPAINAANVEGVFEQLTLVEMKVTKKPIRDETLNGFFFGATERERAMATKLGDKYCFAFVVLSDQNTHGKPFAVLLSLQELSVGRGRGASSSKSTSERICPSLT